MSLSSLKIKLRPIAARIAKDSAQRNALSKRVTDPSVLATFGKLAVDQIEKRTLGGKDKNDIRFKEYSKSYANSRQYKIFKGNRPRDKVNLRLMGSMLADMSVRSFSTSTATVTLHIPFPTLNERAEWHVKGMGNNPVRDFWGLTDAEEERILKESLRITAGDEGQLLALALAAATQVTENIADVEGESLTSVESNLDDIADVDILEDIF